MNREEVVKEMAQALASYMVHSTPDVLERLERLEQNTAKDFPKDFKNIEMDALNLALGVSPSSTRKARN